MEGTNTWYLKNEYLGAILWLVRFRRGYLSEEGAGEVQENDKHKQNDKHKLIGCGLYKTANNNDGKGK